MDHWTGFLYTLAHNLRATLPENLWRGSLTSESAYISSVESLSQPPVLKKSSVGKPRVYSSFMQTLKALHSLITAFPGCIPKAGFLWTSLLFPGTCSCLFHGTDFLLVHPKCFLIDFSQAGETLILPCRCWQQMQKNKIRFLAVNFQFTIWNC